MHYFPNLVAAAALCNTLLGSYAQVTTSCNPLKGVCPNDKGLPSSVYSVDFTSIKTLPSEWIAADQTKVTLGASGAELTFNKRYDAPTMQTNFNFFYGRVEYVVQAAPGTGIISSMVLLSDDLDEVDWEFRGGITDSVQTNYFGKGYTGTYNRSTTVPLTTPQASFHTYTLDWSPESLVWSIDGKIVRTLDAADADGNGSQYPQTPMKVSLSLWDGGDPDTNPSTVKWAGGYTPLPPPQPWTMYVKSVKIWNANPGQQYQYTDRSGSSKSIKVINETLASNSSTAIRSTETLSLGPTTSVLKQANGTSVPGVNSSSLISNLSISTVSAHTTRALTNGSSVSGFISSSRLSNLSIATVSAHTTMALINTSTHPSSLLLPTSSCNSTVGPMTSVSQQATKSPVSNVDSSSPISSQVPPSVLTPTTIAPNSTSVKSSSPLLSTSSCNSTVTASGPMSSTAPVSSSVVVSSTVSPVSAQATQAPNSTPVVTSSPLLSTSSYNSTVTAPSAMPSTVPVSSPITSTTVASTSSIPANNSTSTSPLLTSKTAAGTSYASPAASPDSSASGYSVVQISDSMQASSTAAVTTTSPTSVSTSRPSPDGSISDQVKVPATTALVSSTTPQATTSAGACTCAALVSNMQTTAVGADSNITTSQSVVAGASPTPGPSDTSDETKPDSPSDRASNSPADDDSQKEITHTNTSDSDVTTTVYNYRTTTSTATIRNASVTSVPYPMNNASSPTNGSVASISAASISATGATKAYSKYSMSPVPFRGDGAKVRVAWSLPVIAGTVAGFLLLL